jgi:6-phosphofructokinase 1
MANKVPTKQRIGILTAGGDCPGINAAIRGVGKTAILKYNMQVIGISDGFTGLINKEYIDLTEKSLSGILTLGGTILGTSREKPYKGNDKKKPDLRKPLLI